MARVPADPWGNTYLTNADGFKIINREVWIILAGPNGQIDTPVLNTVVIGDDIGIRLQQELSLHYKTFTIYSQGYSVL
jgi:hypothetical protein